MYDRIDEIIAENNLRKQRLHVDYDPLLGIGCCGRRVFVPNPNGTGMTAVPRQMVDDPAYFHEMTLAAWERLRCRHDFEYWAARCVKIRAKTTGRLVPFVLNAPQRRVLAMLEEDRSAGRPMRMIMLKARQWGGSTLIQIYMTWIQICIDPDRNSLICAHVKDTSNVIRGMYSTLLANYPPELWDSEEKPAFRPYEGAANIRVISGLGSRVAVGSAERPDSLRGADYAMAHLSEVAYWRKSPGTSPEMLIASVCGAVNYEPLTLIVMESTANGPGNYFHNEWLRAEAGESDKRPVFVPWFEIERYSLPVDNPEKLVREMDDYEKSLWTRGLTLEQIQWYHNKRREMSLPSMMRAEYPSTPAEAFAAADRSVFGADSCERLRRDCSPPTEIGEVEGESLTGPEAIKGVKFRPATFPNGLKIWKMPVAKQQGDRYIAAVDVGGRSDKADWSVIVVIDRRGGDDGATPEVVAQWRGHCDHDLLAWKSAAIARFYNDALLVFESNTFETDNIEGDPSLYILGEVQNAYPRLYYRPAGTSVRIGFHTNSSTKTALISRMIAAVRDGRYIERATEAVDELLVYEVKPNGRYGAREGYHDDMLMARAIALHVAAEQPALPSAPKENDRNYVNHYRW